MQDSANSEPSHYLLDFGAAGLAEPLRGDWMPPTSHWNVIQYSPALGWSLKDHQGQNLGVSLELLGAGSWVQCDLMGPMSDLLGGGVHGVGEPLEIRVNGLDPGLYSLVLFAKPRCQAGSTRIQVRGGNPRMLCLEGDAGGQDAEAQVFLVPAPEGVLEWSLVPSAAHAQARLAGAMWTRLGPDCESVLIHAGGVRWLVGRGSGIAGPVVWSRAIPSRTGSKAGEVALGFVGFSFEGATPFPGPAPAGRGLLLKRRVPEFARGGQAGLHLVGSSLWVQGAGRDSKGRLVPGRSRWLQP